MTRCYDSKKIKLGKKKPKRLGKKISFWVLISTNTNHIT